MNIAIKEVPLNDLRANFLEHERWVEAKDPAGQGDKHLRQRWVNIHEESSLDVLGGEPAKVDFVKAIP